MATLQQIQKEELCLLSHLHNVCTENNVRYSMIGGTMLGAVRHKGFIPWDDDIDVFMQYEDFQRIKDKLSNDSYFLQTPSSDLQMPFAMYKLRRNHSQMLEPGMEALSIHHGIWIDIFVYFDAGKNDRRKNIQKKLFLFLKSYRCRHLNVINSPTRKMHLFLTKLPRRLQLFIDQTLIFLIKFFGNKPSGEYFALDVGKHCIYPKEFFDQLSEYVFENALFYGPSDYDGFLTMIFGPDYMIPRKWGHLPDYSDVLID